ncbi:hypothetical protein SBC1_20460 [Caballeronia sp. SBC1]|uniref:hypothetical protein n=1 Tax=unclassified Caballeronia TaxID=2646786 RepID=UPI0013E1E048|nr:MULTISPECIES: hypothetical protein [unclassified Caballeronia]QIE24153.1 hypothetical protein SBC2_21840 [Caballeronia sp. SBC2]QIN62049.1 hypothetical protein SBC1_20460 [Caballeronia sp. SBC1]
MPVTLPPAESPEPRPSPPRLVVWLCLLVVSMVIGVVSTLLTWPENVPTGTAWFWVRLLVFPFLVCTIAFGLRCFYYEQENERINADNEILREDRETALEFASDPLAVVRYAYLTGAGSRDVASTLDRAAAALEAHTFPNGSDVFPLSSLSLAGDDDDPGRYCACFRELIGSVSDSVKAIPRDVPFGVCLQLPVDVDQQALVDAWQACWDDAELRAVKAELVATDKGLMALDQWLDNKGGPALEKFVLFVAVQLHETPLQNSAEAAVALLLGWAPLAQRRHIEPVALLHRPVEADLDATDAPISTALQWGRTTGDKINDLWQTGLERMDKAALVNSLSDLSIGVSQTENLAGIHDLDITLGYSGNAAGWLAVALGIEHATQNNTTQLVAWRESTLRFVVVQPVEQADTTDSGA